MKHVDIYTDGACSANPGPGPYRAILVFRGHEMEISGRSPETTNNRMEIFAAIAALEQLIEPCEITLYSDSRYLVDAVSKRWLANWKRRGWIKADKQPVLNVDLWRRLEAAMAPHRLKFVWVRGHASNAENNRCDELAVAAATRGNLPEDPR